MPYINSTQFGEITIDNKKYQQVLIIEDEVEERKYKKLKELFGTSHKIGDWEIEKLLGNKPEIIIVGTGQNGALEVDEDTAKKLKTNDSELIIVKTPEAIEIYNQKTKENKKVNALMHTTC